MKHRLLHTVCVSLLCILGLAYMTTANAQPRPDKLKNVDVKEHLGDSIDLTLPFVDADGNDVRLGDYFRDGEPVILTLNYYNCPMLCSLQLNALIDGLKELPWSVGENFKIITISIDPREGPDLAAAKRATYLKSLGDGEDADWSFLTGEQPDIQKLAGELGFEYRYVREVDEYAHPAAIYFLSPKGKITRYLYGLNYRPFDLRMAILEASDGKIGTTVDHVILSCFHYNSSSNSYSVFAFGVMRLLGGLTFLILASILGILWFRDRRRRTA